MPYQSKFNQASEADMKRKIEEAQEILSREVESIQSGEDWKSFLDFQSQLHAYSPNNVLLIATQHHQAFTDGRVNEPQPSFVAGFNTWKALGRQVEKGQKGYIILAPCKYNKRVALSQDGGKRELTRGERPESGERLVNEVKLMGFRTEYVFDISQTSGKDIPIGPMPILLKGEAPVGFKDSLVNLLEKYGYRTDYVDSANKIGGANGQTIPDLKLVQIRDDMDESAKVKTLLHESAHVILHTTYPGIKFPRHVQEVEAESVAYVVAKAHSMDTDEYSFPYVARWAGEDGVSALVTTQQRVAKASKELIEASNSIHNSGGKVPGIEFIVNRAKSRDLDLEMVTSMVADSQVAI